jgi:hypothetical protein
MRCVCVGRANVKTRPALLLKDIHRYSLKSRICPVQSVQSHLFVYLSLNQKAIEPLGEAVPNTELFRRLARTMGFARPVLYCALERGTGSSETVAGVEQAIDLRPIPRPLLDFVEVAVVGITSRYRSPRGR